mmetsp:Transcript_11379/g.28132  ORF Transcript_11379/g.28132 Transcript_11379/m.28132 type:complete len:273 (+) Transcript_11379:3108-3926(+)
MESGNDSPLHPIPHRRSPLARFNLGCCRCQIGVLYVHLQLHFVCAPLAKVEQQDGAELAKPARALRSKVHLYATGAPLSLDFGCGRALLGGGRAPLMCSVQLPSKLALERYQLELWSGNRVDLLVHDLDREYMGDTEPHGCRVPIHTVDLNFLRLHPCLRFQTHLLQSKPSVVESLPLERKPRTGQEELVLFAVFGTCRPFALLKQAVNACRVAEPHYRSPCVLSFVSLKLEELDRTDRRVLLYFLHKAWLVPTHGHLKAHHIELALTHGLG